MKKKRTYLEIIFTFIIFILISSCSATKEPTTIKVVFVPFLSNAPFFIGVEEGYFEEQGFTLEFFEVERTSEAIPALEQGDVDVVGGLISTGTLNAIARGANIKFVADKGHVTSTGCNTSTLVASKAFNEAHPSKNPADLKGARISINPASLSGFWAEIFLRQANLTLDDIDDLQTTNAAEFEMLQENSIDLASTDEPWTTRNIQNGGVAWVSYGDLVPDASYAHVWFGPTFLEQNPDLGKRFMIAYLKGVAQYNQGKTERNLEILEKHLELDKDLLRQTCWPSVNNDGTINPDTILMFQEWALEKGLLDSKLEINQFWDPSYIEYAAKQLNIIK
jgi:NitT/TauT family transport system substrate-binding protein